MPNVATQKKKSATFRKSLYHLIKWKGYTFAPTVTPLAPLGDNGQHVCDLLH